ncbi:MAG: hydrolase [Dehalococcoidia bacterium]|nr:MAG: hydrolase [Dehalococcoidia bacterium]
MPRAQLNDHPMYYEVHGQGEPVLCMTGWGTYCHGAVHHLPRGLTERYQVIIFDHRGLGESGDSPNQSPTMALYAADAAALLDLLGIRRAHVVGLVGMGACIAQELALARPDLVRSLFLMGAWARVDPYFRDQLELFRFLHGEVDFFAFQRAVTLLSFDPDYYNANKERLLGPSGVWSELLDRFPAHSRLIDACLAHDTLDRLPAIAAPTLVVHAGADQVTGPRLTRPIEEAIPHARGVLLERAPHVIAGRVLKQAFCELLFDFLAVH